MRGASLRALGKEGLISREKSQKRREILEASISLWV